MQAKKTFNPIPGQAHYESYIKLIFSELCNIPGAFPVMTPGKQILIFEEVVILTTDRKIGLYDKVFPDDITTFDDIQEVVSHFMDKYLIGNKK